MNNINNITENNKKIEKITFRHSFWSLCLWIGTLWIMGAYLGISTKSSVETWSNTLKQSPLTPPNYMFSVVWTILYGCLGIGGWLIWKNNSKNFKYLKILYIFQILLNWLWVPVFFNYHDTALAFIILLLMNMILWGIYWISYGKIKKLFFLLIPYGIWIGFASYLNLYVWLYN